LKQILKLKKVQISWVYLFFGEADAPLSFYSRMQIAAIAVVHHNTKTPELCTTHLSFKKE
jgi:hypothetical protein